MNNIGKITCHRCKHTFDVKEVFYYDSEDGVIFSLKNKGTGYVADNIQFLGSLPNTSTITIKNVTKLNGIPYQVAVVYTGTAVKKEKVLFPENRICPHCAQAAHKEIVYLMPKAGYFPTFLIAEVGSPATGKSTWLTSVSSRKSDRKILGSTANCEIEIYDAHQAQKEMAHLPTAITEMRHHTFKVMRHNKTVALIYLLDLAGEFSKRSAAYNGEFGNLLSFMMDKVDGILAFYDPRYVKGPSMRTYTDRRNENVEGDFYNIFSYFQDFRKTPPVAMVMTGADEIRKSMMSTGAVKSEIGQVILTSDSPLFKECTLSTNEILKHMALAGDFMKEGTDIRMTGKANEGYFLISSGQNVDRTHFDYRGAYNVELPLLWMLNQIGVVQVRG